MVRGMSTDEKIREAHARLETIVRLSQALESVAVADRMTGEGRAYRAFGMDLRTTVRRAIADAYAHGKAGK